MSEREINTFILFTIEGVWKYIQTGLILSYYTFLLETNSLDIQKIIHALMLRYGRTDSQNKARQPIAVIIFKDEGLKCESTFTDIKKYSKV